MVCLHPRHLLALACVAIALPLGAQTVTYKVRLPDGSILLTDRPPPNAKVLEKFESRPNTNVMTPPARVSPERKTEGSARADDRSSTLDAADQEVKDAESALAAAKAALERGREPQEGDLRGTRSGGTRASPEFEARIRALEEAVAAAEERVKRAYAARNAAR